MRNRRPAYPPLPLRAASLNLLRVIGARRSWRALLHKLSRERLLMRASALAYDTLLAIVPFMAVSMASVGVLGGQDTLSRLLRELSMYYVPSSAEAAVDHLIGLAETLDLHAIGLIGLLALLPVVFALIDAVEHTLADVFGTPRRTHWWRLLLLGALLSLAPLGSVLSVRYVSVRALPLHQLLTPIGLLTALLYVVFRHIPKVRVSRRAAAVGALSAALILSLAKLAFGLYAQLAVSLHVLWGAVAFVPLFLLWVLLSWYAVLFAAAVTPVLQHELLLLEAPSVARPGRPRRRRSRLRRRLVLLRHLPSADPQLDSLPSDVSNGHKPRQTVK